MLPQSSNLGSEILYLVILPFFSSTPSDPHTLPRRIVSLVGTGHESLTVSSIPLKFKDKSPKHIFFRNMKAKTLMSTSNYLHCKEFNKRLM